MKLEGKKFLILIEDLYNEYEFWCPYYRFIEEGAEVSVVGSGKKEYKSKHGLPVHPDINVKDVDTSKFDALIIPGGYAPDVMRRSKDMVRVVKEMFEKGKVVAAICHAGWMLASAGILKGKKVTGFFAIKDDLVHAGAEYIDAEVVVDGNLITSRKPDDIPAFHRAIIEALS
ncbi:MAG TPA: type 1 glutamine amidotransferase domain-containing protein [Nitrospinota bacterium]|nr:type 1 glutamine amidotransferase domain-containing protein [Nitrospinota bacterium]